MKDESKLKFISISIDDHKRRRSKTVIHVNIRPADTQHLQSKSNKKQKKQRKYIKIILITCIALIIITAAIIMGLLIKLNKVPPILKELLDLRWNPTGTTILGMTSVNVSAAYELSYPYGIAFDLLGDLYVADYSYNRVNQLFMRTRTVVIIAGQTNEAKGSGPFDLYSQTYMAFDSNNNMYVLDRNNRRVEFYFQGNLEVLSI